MAEILVVAGVSAFIAWMWPGKSGADAKKDLEKMKAVDPALIPLYSEIGTKMTQLRAITAKVPDSITMHDAWVARQDFDHTSIKDGKVYMGLQRPDCFICCAAMKRAKEYAYNKCLVNDVEFDQWRDAIAQGNLTGWKDMTPVQHAREVIWILDGRIRDAARMGYR
jgi:hypothetical protein